MFLAMSADTALWADFGAGAPTLLAPSCVPSHENWLKFLSLSVPTSVTRPIFRAEPPPGAVLVPALGAALGAPLDPELLHAPTRMAAAATRASDLGIIRTAWSSCETV